MKGTIDSKLNTVIQWVEVTSLGDEIFKEGHFERLDDFIILILPIINMTYYQSIRSLDDREYAKDDLIQDTVVALYRDMSLRWDKYIRVENYGEYVKTVSRNIMINLVHRYHNYYSTVEYDPDTAGANSDSAREYSVVEAKLLKKQFDTQILEMTRRLASYRKDANQLLQRIITSLYIDKDEEMTRLKIRYRVLGVHYDKFNMYINHVKYLYRLVYNYQKALLRGDDKMSSQLEEVMDRFGSDTYETLTKNYGDTVIPELFAEFGRETTMKIVKVFSGQTIKVPDYRSLCDDLLGASVYQMANGRKEDLARLSEEYSLPYKTLSRIFDRQLKNLGGK